MKRRNFSWALAVLTALGALLVAGCATTEYRISQYPALYQTLSPRDQGLVREGRIREGMSQDAVFLAWGSPAERLSGRSRGRQIETWVFTTTRTAYSPHFGFGLGFGSYGGGYYRHRGGYRYHHFGYYDPFYDPFFYSRFETVEVPSRIVSFQNGRVVGYQFMNPATQAATTAP